MTDIAHRRTALLDQFVDDVVKRGPDRRMLRIRAEGLILQAEKLERERWFPAETGAGLSDKVIGVVVDGGPLVLSKIDR